MTGPHHPPPPAEAIATDGREAARLAALARLDAVRPDADMVLQELVDGARALFGTALCMVNLITADQQYFRAWSGALPADLAAARQDPRERSMCQYVVEAEAPLVVPDFLATEAFREQHFCLHHGIHFYAGTPLVTADGHAIGSLCLLDVAPRPFDASQLATLGAFARAAVSRLETLALLGRERTASREKDALLASLRAANHEEALRHAAELARTLTHAHDLIVVVGFDGMIRRINPACLPILGYRPEELTGRRIAAFIHPADRAAAFATAGTSVHGFTNRCRRRGGGTVWLEWRATPVPEEGAMYCVARDITARVVAEEAMRASEERLRTVVANLPVILTATDAAGRITLSEGRGLAKLGAAPGDAVGRTVGEIFGGNAAIMADLGRGLQGESFSSTREHRGVTFENHYSPLTGPDGTLAGRITVSVDVTERVEAEAALRESEAALRAAQRIAGLGSWVTDLASGASVWSDELYRLHGVAPGAFAPSLEAILPLVHPDDRARVRAWIMGELAETTLTHRIVRPDGEERVVQGQYEILRDEQGRATRLIGTLLDITARVAAEAALRASEARNTAILDATPDILLRLGRDGVYRDFRAPGDAPVELRPGHYIGHHLRERHTPGFVALMLGQVARALDTGLMQTFEYFHDTPLGRAEFEARLVSSGPDEVLGVVRNITAQKRAEEARDRSELRARAIVDNAFDAILTVAADGAIRSFNPAAECVFGYPAAAVVGRPLTVLMPERFRAAHEAGVRRYLATGQARVLGQVLEVEGQRADGTIFPLELTLTVAQGEGETFFTGIMRDIGERKAFESRLHHQAFHDPLTDLPNRARFLDRLGQALAGGRRGDGRVAILLLDLDRFKVVNDSLGHEVGDDLLIAVAARLRAGLRSQDTIARLGGDEFAILMEDAVGVEVVAPIAERLLHELQTPFSLAGREFVISGSVGIALGTAGESPAELLRSADLALYRAKDRGKGRYDIFDAGLHAAASARLALEADLRRALAEGEFLLHYQPKVDLATGRTVGVEALVRWAHPTRGLVPPGEFIPLAEETGLIVPLGRWVLATACRQARAGADENPGDRPLTMSINLSARQFLQPDLLADIAGILRESGTDPALIELEITESVLAEDAGATLALLEGLRGLGVKLALDDFGTGYSSLAYLKRFPVDVLKVDKAFVSELGREPENEAIAGAIITLAHALGMVVVAEGVETAAAADRLRALGCDLGQGYYFARPLPRAALDALLAAERARTAAGRPGGGVSAGS